MQDIEHQIESAPLTKDEAREQFVKTTERLGIKHVFSFDDAWDFVVHKRSQDFFNQKVAEFSEKMKASEGHRGHNGLHAFNPTTHSFADGQYIREIFNPANEIIVTKVHLKNHPFFLLEGKMSIITAEGFETIEAPYYGVTKAGTRRIIMAHEDCRFVTVHRTDSLSVSDIEKEVVADSFEELKLEPRETAHIEELIEGLEN
tara:strand:+ start:1633 stop:2238 length:606 start_codon:yes stop_codon:yes gene_type:complete